MGYLAINKLLWLTLLAIAVERTQGDNCSCLRPPVNGYVTIRSQQGYTAQYGCNQGYHFHGSPTRICQSDGTWSGEEPTCSTSPCGPPNLPPGAKISSVRNTKRGPALLIGCQQHYLLLTRLGLMFCDKTAQLWLVYRKVSCLLKTCPSPVVPKNGFKEGLSYLVNDKVKFKCDKCYTLVGHSQRTCLKNRSWSHAQPKCVLNTCPAPNNIAETTVHYSSQYCGAIARYQCNNRHHRMLGSGEKTCSENGVWTGDEPKCVDVNPNIALGKPTQQSPVMSRGYPGPSSRAVDGNRNTIYSSTGSCTHTAANLNPWWRVDLGKKEIVSMVIVVNRGDCCARRLNNFEVWVGDDKDYRKGSKCGGKARPGLGEVIKIRCASVLQGRYVIVRVPRYDFMTLCEVEVYRMTIY